MGYLQEIPLNTYRRGRKSRGGMDPGSCVQTLTRYYILPKESQSKSYPRKEVIHFRPAGGYLRVTPRRRNGAQGNTPTAQRRARMPRKDRPRKDRPRKDRRKATKELGARVKAN